jgi:hypothetical protein
MIFFLLFWLVSAGLTLLIIAKIEKCITLFDVGMSLLCGPIATIPAFFQFGHEINLWTKK